MSIELEKTFFAVINNLNKMASEDRFQEKAELAFNLYTRKVGTIFPEDDSYDARISLFLEWFIFDFMLTEDGATILDVYKDEMARGSDQELLIISALKNNVRDIFLVKGSKNGVAKVKALYKDKIYTLSCGHLGDLFVKGGLFEARVVELDGKLLPTQGICHHPAETLRFIKSEIKRIEGSNGSVPDSLFCKLTRSSIKLERSRYIDASQIYETPDK